MYMLARAQSLSGRPHDALVMLLRLADRGYTTDAAVNEDFAAVRRLPQWPDLAARLRDMSPPPAPDAAPGEASPSAPIPAPPPPSAIPAPPAPSPRPAGPAAPGGAAAAPRHAAAMPFAPGLRGAEEALRVPALAMTPIALAHDRASGRFVFGGASSRKLVIVDERMHLVVDLVREASAGFYDIAAFEIDPWRGDLWVVSADEKAGATALHHVQMVSGRPLERLDLPNGLMPGRFVDVAVTRDAIVYVLDAAGQRLFSVRQKERALTSPHGSIYPARRASRRPVTGSCTWRTSAASHASTPARGTPSRCAWAASPCRRSRASVGPVARCSGWSASMMARAGSCGCGSSQRPHGHVLRRCWPLGLRYRPLPQRRLAKTPSTTSAARRERRPAPATTPWSGASRFGPE